MAAILVGPHLSTRGKSTRYARARRHQLAEGRDDAEEGIGDGHDLCPAQPTGTRASSVSMKSSLVTPSASASKVMTTRCRSTDLAITCTSSGTT